MDFSQEDTAKRDSDDRRGIVVDEHNASAQSHAEGICGQHFRDMRDVELSALLELDDGDSAVIGHRSIYRESKVWFDCLPLSERMEQFCLPLHMSKHSLRSRQLGDQGWAGGIKRDMAAGDNGNWMKVVERLQCFYRRPNFIRVPPVSPKWQVKNVESLQR